MSGLFYRNLISCVASNSSLRGNLDNGHVFKHAANRTVATLLSVWKNAASTHC